MKDQAPEDGKSVGTLLRVQKQRCLTCCSVVFVTFFLLSDL